MTEQPAGRPAAPEPTQPWGQQPWPPPAPAGLPPYGVVRPDHHQATTVLVLGVLGLVLCQVASPFAWVMGNRVVREIDASQGALGGRSSASAGRICGIVGTVLLGLGLLSLAALLLFVVVGVGAGLAAGS